MKNRQEINRKSYKRYCVGTMGIRVTSTTAGAKTSGKLKRNYLCKLRIYLPWTKLSRFHAKLSRFHVYIP